MICLWWSASRPSSIRFLLNILNSAMDVLLEQGGDRLKNILIHTTLLEGDRVRISIKDNGPGILEEIRAKISAPSSRTNPINQGTEFWIDLQAHPAQASVAA